MISLMELENKVKSTALTKTERVVANYVLDHTPRVCFMTVAEISNNLKISDTSVIRLARTLGYAGFSDFQQDLRQILEQQITSKSAMSPADRLKRLPHSTDPLNMMFEQVNRNFSESISRNPYEKVEQIAEILESSRLKYIVGFKGCQGIAGKMATTLEQVLPGVRAVLHADSAAYTDFLDLGSEDCVVIFCFPRYSGVALDLAQIALKCGAKLIAITDKAASAPASGADVVLTISTNNMCFNNSHVVTQFYSELITYSVIQRVGTDTVEARLKHLDEMTGTREFY
jgi:DNA-binding MurR/RpiR family transcriptional regulator